MFKSSNANQVLFLKNKLKDVKKGRNEDIQSYFMRITEIKNYILSIGEAIVDRELTLIALRGLPCECHVFNITILNNDMIPGFEGFSGATTIKGMADSITEEKEMLPLLIKEMVALPRDQETPGMMNLMLLITSKNNFILYLPSL